ncbi:hypothetical protein [Mangrovibacter phragmitis]|uniref:hypothetical protein n=1 Tax=Mangrovibacter phragmitis TaxID=1691903 RepID=UPI00351709A4
MPRYLWRQSEQRKKANWALVMMLVPFLLVGCVTLEKARNWFGIAADVCDAVNDMKKNCDD